MPALAIDFTLAAAEIHGAKRPIRRDWRLRLTGYFAIDTLELGFRQSKIPNPEW